MLTINKYAQDLLRCLLLKATAKGITNNSQEYLMLNILKGVGVELMGCHRNMQEMLPSESNREEGTNGNVRNASTGRQVSLS